MRLDTMNREIVEAYLHDREVVLFCGKYGPGVVRLSADEARVVASQLNSLANRLDEEETE